MSDVNSEGFSTTAFPADQRGQTLRGGNRKRIVPGRDDSDHAVRLADQAAGLGLHRQIAVRDGFVAQQAVGVVDQEAGGVEHHQDFGQQRFDIGLAGFAGDQLRDFGFLLMQQALEVAQDAQSACAHRSGP